MKTRHIIAISVAMAASMTVAGAQIRTSYFVKNSLERHQLNPALMPEHGYVGIPMLSDLNVDITSNMGASAFLYPLANGKVGSFLHPDVPVETALSKFGSKNYLNTGMGISIVDVGFFTRNRSFWSIGIRMRADINANIPYDAFALLKKGMESRSSITYDLSGLSINAQASVEMSAGYARKIGDDLQVGGKIKLFVPAGGSNIKANRLYLTMSDEQWKTESDMTAEILVNGVKFDTDEKGLINKINSSGLSIGPSGFGAGIDLGAVYNFSEDNILHGLSLSASITDLGFMSYSKGCVANSNGNVTYTGIADFDIMNPEASSDKIKSTFNDLLKMLDLRPGTLTSSTTMLNGRVNVGAEYAFAADKMSVGALFTTAIGGLSHFTEFMLTYNYRPVSWFNAALSYSVINGFNSFGWMISLSPSKGMDFFIGSDYLPLSWTPQGIPVSKASATINFGLAVPLGK